MRDLCLDWWEMGPNELDGLVKACTSLSRLQVGVSFPIVKLVGTSHAGGDRAYKRSR
jgi:hypothetical protein